MKRALVVFSAAVFGFVAISANAQTVSVSELQARLISTLERVNVLLAQVAGDDSIIIDSEEADEDDAPPELITKDLDVGSTDPDVARLQLFLKQQGLIQKGVRISGKYDEVTSRGVKRFQIKSDIAAKVARKGAVDTLTREYINAAADDRSEDEFNAAALEAVSEYQSKKSQATENRLKRTLARRQATLARLVKTNPRQARRMMLAREARAKVPVKLSGLVEREERIDGKVIVMHEDYADDDFSSDTFYALTGNKKTVELAGVEALSPNQTVSGNFYLVDNVALADSSFLTSAASEVSSVTPVLEKNVAAVMINFPDRPQTTYSREYFASQVLPEITRYYDTISYGRQRTNIQLYGWYTSTKPASEIVCDSTAFPALKQQAVELADPDIDFSSVTELTIFAPQMPCSSTWRGLGTVGPWSPIETQEGTFRTAVSMTFADFTSVPLHELGHNFGVWHANYIFCGAQSFAQDPETCTGYEYYDKYDVMGKADYKGHMNVYSKNKLGFLEADSVMNVTESGIYAITPLETPGGVKALTIRRRNGTYFWLEYRRPQNYDSIFGTTELNGLFVRVGQYMLGLHGSFVIDGSPSRTTVSYTNVVFPPGVRFADPDTGAAFTLLSNNDISAVVRIEIPSLPVVSPVPIPTPEPYVGVPRPGDLIIESTTIDDGKLYLGGRDSSVSLSLKNVRPYATFEDISLVIEVKGSSGKKWKSLPILIDCGDGLGVLRGNAEGTAQCRMTAPFRISNVGTTPKSAYLLPNTSVKFTLRVDHPYRRGVVGREISGVSLVSNIIMCPEIALSPPLERPATGAQVRALQKFLWQYQDIYVWGAKNLKQSKLISGRYDALTTRFVTAFQKQFNVRLAKGEKGKVYAATAAEINRQCGGGVAAADGQQSASNPTPTPTPISSCLKPYHVLTSDGRCVWSCGTGTQPDFATQQCKCQSGYTQTGVDSLGRITCTISTSSAKPPASVQTNILAEIIQSMGDTFRAALTEVGYLLFGR